MNEEHEANFTVAARKFSHKDAEVVLLMNPTPDMVTEISALDYVPGSLLEEQCFPQAHPWP